jgi:hypothetical protein
MNGYLPNPTVGVPRLSLLVGLVAGEMCSVFATFVGHTMSPVSYRLVENDHSLRAIYGRYQEINNWNGLILTLALSIVVFTLAWFAVQGIARPTRIRRSWDYVNANVRALVLQITERDSYIGFRATHHVLLTSRDRHRNRVRI